MTTRALAVAIRLIVAVVVVAVPSRGGVEAQAVRQPPPTVTVPPLPEAPFEVRTAEEKIRVTVVTRDLSYPWSLAFLPDGGLIVTERAGRLRIIRDGTLDPKPIAGVPEVFGGGGILGLMDVALHPRFAENKLVYLTYHKALGGNSSTVALARGRWTGAALADVRDIFVTNPRSGPSVGTDALSNAGGNASRIAFGRDGTIFMTVGIGDAPHASRAQDPNDDAGKVLRLNDDGTVPPDNPFVGRAGYRPEIYTIGHRNQMGLAVHPETGAVWENENGPNGGDEINVLMPGRNYGWPIVSYGRQYTGPRVSEKPWQEGMEQPALFWVPSIAVTGMTFYTGDKFPAWKGNVFVGGLRTGVVAGTGHVERLVFNAQGEEIRRESLLTELHQRIRDVRQGPDGYLYVLTDENKAGLLKIEPALPLRTDR